MDRIQLDSTDNTELTEYKFTVHRIQSGQNTTLQYPEYRVDRNQLYSTDNTE